MRRIPVDQAQRRQAETHGAAADALTRLAAEDARAGRLMEPRSFAGLSLDDAAAIVGISRSTAYEHWSYARARLRTLPDGV